MSKHLATLSRPCVFKIGTLMSGFLLWHENSIYLEVSMNMNIRQYKDKVKGCWLGKNIGGTLGGPFESQRGVFDLEFYTHDISQGVLPNDDLDLQLVWLNAAEKYGKSIDSEILGEFWLSYIVADCSEYGAGKNNLAMGFLPPISGWYNNTCKESCGCFIRSEIWACLAPGHPEIAVQYAYEDAIVDHSNEGVYAEIFCAALESAAFSESDRDKLINIGLSYIPQDCATTLAVRTAIDCYKASLTWKEARKKVLQTVPGCFGHVYEGNEVENDLPFSEVGFNAPSNIGLMIIGWLFGDGDFSKSICIAAGCGEDTDCTAATIGAIMGIICGASLIPQKWLDPIGDEIKTLCVDLTKGETIKIPKTITELTNRVGALMPTFMGSYCDIMCEEGVILNFNESNKLFDCGVFKGRIGKDIMVTTLFKDKLKEQPFGVKRKSVPYDVTFDYIDGIKIYEGIEKKIILHIENNLVKQQWLTVKWLLPPEWTVSPSVETVFNLNQRHAFIATSEAEYIITPNAINKGKYDLILEIKSNGRVGTMYIPITFISSI
jgi:ADP-ribosylglycohydrolase